MSNFDLPPDVPGLDAFAPKPYPQLPPPGSALPFLTGSHAYGTPNEASDVDLVLLCNDETRLLLVRMLMATAPGADDYSADVGQFKIGKLNLIFSQSAAGHAAWLEGTRQLQAKAPRTRAQAVALLKPLIKAAKEATEPAPVSVNETPCLHPSIDVHTGECGRCGENISSDTEAGE